MVTIDEKRAFCEALGLRIEQVKVERLPHPTKRAHTIYRVSHPAFGEGIAALEHDAWHAFMDRAEHAAPLPERCEGLKADGSRCKNAPQAGQRFCGPHLTAATKPQQALCQATTKSGQPCKSAPQKGEIYCGPHLTQHKGVR